jgi:hypothetical protein
MEHRIETGTNAVKAVLGQIREALLNPETGFILLTRTGNEMKTVSNITCESCKAGILLDAAEQIAAALPDDAEPHVAAAFYGQQVH